MKRIVPLLLCAIMIFTMLPVQAKADDVTINVYNWGQYIADGTGRIYRLSTRPSTEKIRQSR